MWLKSKIAKISTLNVKRIAKSLKFDPVNNSSLKVPANKICHKRPTEIFGSATYVVNITKLRHPDDIKKDNFGIWSHSVSHPQLLKVFEEDNNISIEKCAPGATGDSVVHLRLLHSVHTVNKQFKRMIACITGKYLIMCSAIVGTYL